MGGSPKTATTTQSVQIPPEVMARYNAVNTRAEAAASQPFKAYSQDPNAFVAPMTQTQQTAMQNINQATGMSQPYTNAAAGLMMSGAQGVGPLTQQQIQNYQNPYTQSVVDATMAGLRQQQGQELSKQQGEAIRAGAFGGDRAGLQRAQLMGQQGLATAQAISPLYQRAYEQAVSTAAGQQGVQAADLQRQLTAGQQLGGLGAQAQRSAIEGAQAQFGMGTAEQQTQQAGLSALYNQFLQERGYDFQTAQFLANIAMGTGALSGSTTTTAQPIPFMSDEREKTNIQPLGKGMYAYDYKDDVAAAERGERAMPPKRVGPMAQDIEERAPGLVGEINGHKVVKGLSPESMGGAVVDLGPGEYRENYAQGGGLAALYAQFGAPYGAQQGITDGPYGGRAGYLKAGLSPPRDIAFKADTRQVKPISTIMQEASRGAEQASNFANMFDPEKSPLAKGAQKGFGALQSAYQSATRPAGPTIDETSLTAQGLTDPSDPFRLPGARARGGLVGYAEGGGVDDDKSPVEAYDTPGAGLGIPTEMRQHKMMEPGKPPGAPKSIMSDITDAAKVAASIYAMSDERMKSGMQQVGELYNGLPVYKYRMGDGPSQLGLSAQEARGLHPEAVMEGKDGLLRLNYDRATRAYGGGLDPRGEYQAGGSPSFDEALRRTLAYEGGYTEDTGGPTMMGISSRANPDVDLGRVKEDPEYRASLYRDRYWNPIGADRMDPRMANVAFDTAVNLGVGRTRQLLDEAGGDPAKLLQLRQQHYNDLVARDPEKYGRYERGWSNRVNDLMAYAGQPEQSAATRAIDTATGTPSGLGRAAEASTKAPQEERGFLASILPTKFGTKTLANPKGEQFSGLGEFVTSRQFLQPLAEGLAGMASSPSLFAGPAALQGLGAASRSYTNLEKEMAGVERQQEETRQVAAGTTNIMQENVKRAYFQSGGQDYVLLADGRPVRRSLYEQNPAYYGEVASAAQLRAYTERNPQAKPLSDLRPPYEAPPPAAPREGDLTKKEPEQPAQTLLTESPKFETGKPTPYSLVGNVGASEIERDARNATLRTAEMNKKEAEKTQTELSKLRQSSDGFLDVATQFDKLASLALSLPDGGFGAPGPLNQLQLQWANYYNSIINTIPVPDDVRKNLMIKPQEVGLREGLDKVKAALELSMGQQSRDALAVASSAVPNANMSRRGFIEAYAPERVRLQRFLDESRYVQEYQRTYEKKHQASFPDAWSIESARNAFKSDTSPNLYRDDTERLKWLMSNVDPKTGKTYWSLYAQNRVPTHFVDRQTGAIGYRRYFEGFR